MRRSTPRLAGTALVLVVGLAVAGCSSKSADNSGSGSSASSTGGSSAALSIQPLVQIDNKGAEVKVDNSGTPADPAGNKGAKCDPVTIAMAGALTGPNAALGINILNGATLAIDAHNAASPDCQVAIKQFDTEGDPQKATQVAPTIVGDASIIGLLGPAFSGETKAVGPVFNQAGLLSLTASATNPDLTTNGWTNFFRGLANDAVQGPSVAAYMVNTLKYAKVCVVQDDSDYGVGLAEQITTGLGDAADSNCAAKVKTGDKDFSAAVQLVKGEEPDAVFYAGYYAEGAPFASQLEVQWRHGRLRLGRRHATTRSSSSRPVTPPRTPTCPAPAARRRSSSRRTTRPSSTSAPASTRSRPTTSPRSCSWASTRA